MVTPPKPGMPNDYEKAQDKGSAMRPVVCRTKSSVILDDDRALITIVNHNDVIHWGRCDFATLF
jgi:hypothetical protein